MSGGVFVSPFNPVQQAGVRAKNPPDLVVASRDPTSKDYGYFPGTLWLNVNNSYWGMLNNFQAGVPFGVWTPFGGASSNVNTINGVAPVGNNINLVDWFTAPGNGAIKITAVGGGQVGIGSKVDGTTIVINGSDQLSAGGTVATTYTEDGGTAIPAGGNLNIFGTSGQGISTAGAGSTVTITAADATTAQKGVTLLATNAETIAGAVTTKAVTPDDLKVKLGAQTQFAVGVGNTQTGAENWVGPGTDGQLLTGQTGANPQFALLTSPGGTVSIGFSAPNVTLDVVGGLAPIEEINLQAGTTPLVPLAGVVTFNGAQVAAAGVPVQTNGTGAHVMALQVQQSKADASPGNVVDNGLAHFDSAFFTVGGAGIANGFVSLLNNQKSAVVTTVGAVTSPLFTIALGAVPGTYTFEIDIAGYVFAGPESPGSVGYTLVGAVRTSGAAATLVPGQALDSFEEVAALMPASAQITVAANNAVISVTGVVADSIRWSGTVKYIFQG